MKFHHFIKKTFKNPLIIGSILVLVIAPIVAVVTMASAKDVPDESDNTTTGSTSVTDEDAETTTASDPAREWALYESYVRAAQEAFDEWKYYENKANEALKSNEKLLAAAKFKVGDTVQTAFGEAKIVSIDGKYLSFFDGTLEYECLILKSETKFSFSEKELLEYNDVDDTTKAQS